mmetsp:Transcript_64729/g.97507  ORF Transcript_64729/g.97507 Transcript_64729/m.97507 type:complete len:90 (-) Transcript_64729:339-608(-)
MLKNATYTAVNFGKKVFCTIFNCTTFSKLGNAIANAAGKMYTATLNVFKKIGDITWTVVEGTGKVFCTVFNCTTAARVKNAVISGWSNF